jgi:hypothetical protein
VFWSTGVLEYCSTGVL